MFSRFHARQHKTIALIKTVQRTLTALPTTTLSEHGPLGRFSANNLPIRVYGGPRTYKPVLEHERHARCFSPSISQVNNVNHNPSYVKLLEARCLLWCVHLV